MFATMVTTRRSQRRLPLQPPQVAAAVSMSPAASTSTASSVDSAARIGDRLRNFHDAIPIASSDDDSSLEDHSHDHEHSMEELEQEEEVLVESAPVVLNLRCMKATKEAYKKQWTLQPSPQFMVSIEALEQFLSLEKDEQKKAKSAWTKFKPAEKSCINASIPGFPPEGSCVKSTPLVYLQPLLHQIAVEYSMRAFR